MEASVICRRSFDSCSWGVVETRGAPGWRWRGIPFVACRSVCLPVCLPAGLSACPLASRCGGVPAPWPCRDRDAVVVIVAVVIAVVIAVIAVVIAGVAAGVLRVYMHHAVLARCAHVGLARARLAQSIAGGHHV